jgi:hypothetical protein
MFYNIIYNENDRGTRKGPPYNIVRAPKTCVHTEGELDDRSGVCCDTVRRYTVVVWSECLCVCVCVYIIILCDVIVSRPIPSAVDVNDHVIGGAYT